MTDRLGWAVVGAGNRARQIMIPALAGSPYARIEGIFGRDLERAKEVAREHDIAVYEDLGELISSEDVNVVYIASPHFLHVPQAVLAIEAGKHVFVEAPLSLSVDGAHKLVEKARSAGVKLGVSFPARFHSAMQKLQKTTVSGELGRIKHVIARCMRPIRFSGWWLDAGRAGPAALLRLGVQALDAAVLAKPEQAVEVTAMGNEAGEDNVNTMVSVILRFKDGMQGYVMAMSEDTAPYSGLTVEGAEGKAMIEGDLAGAGKVALTKIKDGEQSTEEYEGEDPVAAMIEAFTLSVSGDSDYHPTGAEAKKVVEITCAVIESMKSGKTVKVGEVQRLV